MSAERPIITVEPGRERRALHGYPWIYSNELRMDPVARRIPPGTIVQLASARGDVFAVAGFNRHTLIAARVLSLDPDDAVDEAFLIEKLDRAHALRARLYGEPYYRLIHAEADGMPGVVIDRYGGFWVAQLNTATADRLRDALVHALVERFSPEAVILKNDSPLRRLEGLDSEVILAAGAVSGPIRVLENGTWFLADPLEGQKTGWFFDQRDNRAFMASLARDRRVLDLYAHTGGFGIQAAVGGAREVVLVDGSARALELAAMSAEQNGVGAKVHTARADAFAEMERLALAGERFDLVVADPPAFVKSKKDVKAGARAYRKMVRLAAQLVAKDGVLFAASCSHNIDAPLFHAQVAHGLIDAGRRGRIIRSAGAGPDHPVHPLLPESAYLKAIVVALDG